jgi:hypothetical protein
VINCFLEKKSLNNKYCWKNVRILNDLPPSRINNKRIVERVNDPSVHFSSSYGNKISALHLNRNKQAGHKKAGIPSGDAIALKTLAEDRRPVFLDSLSTGEKGAG